MINVAIVQGRLARDPQMHLTQKGMQIATITVANERVSSAGVKRVNWLVVKAFNKLAIVCQDHLSKGRMIMVEGENTTREFTTKEGVKRTAQEISAHWIEFLDAPTKTKVYAGPEDTPPPEEDLYVGFEGSMDETPF